MLQRFDFLRLTSQAHDRSAPVRLLVALATVLALAVAGCSSQAGSPNSAVDDGAQPASDVSTLDPSQQSAATVPINVDKVPADLRTMAKAIYTGAPVGASSRAKTAVDKRAKPAGPVTVAGSLGTWQNTPIGVLTAGKDVTLMVRTSRGWTVVGGWWPALDVPGPVLGGHRHVLIIGSDARHADVAHANADTLQLVGVDGQGGGGILGFARDLWVPIPGRGNGKINSALATGGPQSQVKTMTAMSGLPLEGYVLTGFTGFQGIVNDLGGLTINAPRRVLTIPRGEVTLNGEGALVYARERKTLPRGDVDRSAHAAVMLFGFATMTKARGPLELPEVLSSADKHVVTDLTAEEALTLAAWTHKSDPKRFGRRVAAGPMGISSGGASILRLDGAARQAFADFSDGRL